MRYALTLCAVLGVAACSQPALDREIEPLPAASEPGLLLEPLDRPGIEALYRVTPTLYSGGEPAGDSAFRALAELGVRTVVSVDAALPDVELARQHGLETVHVPMGYSGVQSDVALTLTAVARTRPGPYFVHCHHGVHRGPAAVAILALALGSVERGGATRILETAGTSPRYRGLWRSVAEFEPPTEGVALPALQETRAAANLARAMASLDRSFDRVRAIEAAGWVTPPDHPDIEPAHEALLFWEAMREAKRALPSDPDPGLREEFDRAERSARAFRDAWTDSAPNVAELGQRWSAVEADCESCHQGHRN